MIVHVMQQFKGEAFMVLDLEGSDLGRLGTGSLSTMKFRCSN